MGKPTEAVTMRFAVIAFTMLVAGYPQDALSADPVATLTGHLMPVRSRAARNMFSRMPVGYLMPCLPRLVRLRKSRSWRYVVPVLGAPTWRNTFAPMVRVCPVPGHSMQASSRAPAQVAPTAQL